MRQDAQTRTHLARPIEAVPDAPRRIAAVRALHSLEHRRENVALNQHMICACVERGYTGSCYTAAVARARAKERERGGERARQQRQRRVNNDDDNDDNDVRTIADRSTSTRRK